MIKVPVRARARRFYYGHHASKVFRTSLREEASALFSALEQYQEVSHADHEEEHEPVF